MKRILLRPLLLVAATASPLPAAPAQPELPKDKWIVNLGEHRCLLVRRSGGADGATMVLRAPFGIQRPQLVLSRDGKGRSLPPPDGSLEVRLAPGGAAIAASGNLLRSESGEDMLSFYSLPEDFLDQFAASNELVVRQKDSDLFRIAYRTAAGAIRMLKACNDDLLASWGVDPKLLDALQRKPTPSNDPSTWFRDSDYPDTAIRAGASGSTVVRFTIGTDGRLSGCVPVISSGSGALDAQTCRSLTSRALFHPALGADGQPVAIKSVHSIRWVLPLR